jgi:CotS family spore coat protein
VKGLAIVLIELMRQVNQEYAISTITIKPFHSVWKLNTPGQAYILKKVKSDPTHFTQLAQIVSELYHQNFKSLTPILPTLNGKFYIEFADNLYSLSPWYPGEKPSFRNPQHLKKIAQCFGQLHELSREISFPIALINAQGINEYQTNHDFLESLLPKLPNQKSLNRIDQTIIEWSDHYLQQSRSAFLGLYSFKDLGLLLKNQKGFCHNDPAPGNIIINQQQCYLIDFEFSNCDLWIKEFALLAIRALQATGWNEKEQTLDILIETYNQERPLLEIELKTLPFLLYFPRRFWRFCYQRYQEHLPWTEKRYASRLWEITSEEPKRCRFLEHWRPKLSSSYSFG